jgi:alpha/beta superfamily hydrolase
MKQRKFWFALAGLPLLGLGFFFLNLEPYRPLQVISSEASCRMRVDVVEPIGGETREYVVLFHGLAANRRIMSYLAQDLANQNLRVFVPDFPGHGRTPGPFSPQRAEACGEALVKELIERRSLVSEQTLLVGHSMGGAIAIRVGGRVPVAGVIAISPAPGRTAKLLSREMLPFPDPAQLPKNSLVISGSREPEQMRGIAEAMVKDANDPSSEFVEIPNATHVSLIFSSSTLRSVREWTKKLLGTDADVIRASHFPLYGFLSGTIGLILLCVPFLAEIVGGTAAKGRFDDAAGVLPSRALGQLIVASAIAIVILKFWIPLKVVRVFEGDYLASFLLLAGLVLLAWNAGAVAKAWIFSWRGIGAAAFAAVVFVLLFGLWFDYSFYEAWLTTAKWIRLPTMILAFFPWLLAEEIFLGCYSAASPWRRVILTLAFRSIAWAAIVAALFFLHSGEILMVLLVLYFVLVSLLQRLAMDVVRRETQSATATAVFGAILSAGFALAIFPLA